MRVRARPRGRLRTALVLTVLLGAPLAGAQGAATADATVDATSTPAAVAALLEGLAAHPGRRAADALAEAAALRLDAVRQPLSLVLRFDAQRLTVDPAEEPLPPPFDELFAIDAASESLSATLLLRPFLAGDLADLADQRRADAERAALQAREAAAQLEAQTVQAALGVWLADLAVELAAQGEALAAAAADAAERRAAVGGANEVELGEADRAWREAAASVREARAQRDLAT
ncbi:MAG: hypothetical protein P1P87_12935, partial [Trueperaceae bacterium]|nr:hypothetical protein [Trueperaceae bacterium]